jgi:hypothetical protein
MRSVHFLGIAGALCVVVLFQPFAAHAGDCQSALVGKSYTCDEEDSTGTTETYSADFATGGVSTHFDFYIGSADYGCTCDPLGPISSPSFDDSPTKFECVGNGNSWGLSGTLKGKKLTVEGSYLTGESAILSCKES